MVSARKQMTASTGGSDDAKAKAGDVERGAGGDPSRRPRSNYNYDEAVLKVQEWNEALKCKCYLKFTSDPIHSVLETAPSRPSKHAARRRASDAGPHSPLRSPTDPTMLHASNSGMLQPSTSAFKIGSAPNTKPLSGPLALAEKIREPMAFVLQPPEEQDDNWDDDFEEGISFTKLQGLIRFYSRDTNC